MLVYIIRCKKSDNFKFGVYYGKIDETNEDDELILINGKQEYNTKIKFSELKEYGMNKTIFSDALETELLIKGWFNIESVESFDYTTGVVKPINKEYRNLTMNERFIIKSSYNSFLNDQIQINGKSFKLKVQLERYLGLHLYMNKLSTKLMRVKVLQNILKGEEYNKELVKYLFPPLRASQKEIDAVLSDSDILSECTGKILSFKYVDSLKYREATNDYIVDGFKVGKGIGEIGKFEAVIPGGLLRSKEDKLKWIKENKRDIMINCLVDAAYEDISNSTCDKTDDEIIDILKNAGKYYRIREYGIRLTGTYDNTITIYVSRK